MKSRRPWAVAVVIPAHDEEERVSGALRAVARSLDFARVAGVLGRAAAHVIVVADACGDATALRARRELNRHAALVGEVVTTDDRNVGAARRRGCAIALQRLAAYPPQRVWLAHTDADTAVPAAWLYRQLREAERGAAAVAGVVRVDSFKEHPPGAAERFGALYAIAADGSHQHVHGANMGTRADAYLQVGGWRALSLSEDHCLWNRLRARYPVTATARSWVTTSGRAVGRATGGFADTLRRSVA